MLFRSTLLSTVSTLRAALKLFTIPTVKRVTAKSTINFKSFKRESTILYLCIPLHNVGLYAPFSALLLEQYFKDMMDTLPARDDLYNYALIDELSVLRFRQLGTIFSNCRKSLLGCMAIIQDEKMLELSWRVRNASLTDVVFTPERITLDTFNMVPHLTEPELWTYR